MTNTFFEQTAEKGKEKMKSLLEGGRVASEWVEKGVRHQVETVGENLSAGMKHVQTLSSAKKIEEVVQAQTAFLAEASHKAMDQAKKAFDLMAEGVAVCRTQIETLMKGCCCHGKMGGNETCGSTKPEAGEKSGGHRKS